MLLSNRSRIQIEQGANVATGHVFHGEVHIVGVLERVEEFDEPLASSLGQNVALREDVVDL